MQRPSTTNEPAEESVRPDSAEMRVPGWDEIAEQYAETVLRMAYHLTGDREEAHDLAQDVFVRVYRNLHRYRPGTFEGWLHRITRNLFLDRVRRQAKVRFVPLPEDEWRQGRDNGPCPAERIDSETLPADLETALRRLCDPFRTTVVLCDLQGLTAPEAAEALGCRVGTVRSRLHRGRRALRASLSESCERDERKGQPTS